MSRSGPSQFWSGGKVRRSWECQDILDVGVTGLLVPTFSALIIECGAYVVGKGGSSLGVAHRV